MAINSIFKLKMKIFETAYDGLVKNTKNNIFFGISLKLLVTRYSEFSEDYNPEEKKYFQEILAEKTSNFNVDTYLKKMEDTLLCVSFSKNSLLYKTYGENEICGKYLGLRPGQNVKIRNKQGKLEKKFAQIVFEIAYPTIEDKLLITSFDLKSSDIF